MSDDFLTAESSVEDVLARELYAVTLNQQTWYITSGTDDFVFNGQVYTAEPTSRSNLITPTAKNGAGETLELQIRVDHPVVRRWFQLGVPPKTTSVLATRYQELNGSSEQIWKGEITTIKTSNQIAVISVNGYFGTPMKKRLPTITVARMCPHVLYDSRCRVSPTSFELVTTVEAVDGQLVRVDVADSAKKDDYYLWGGMLHFDTGEWMTIGKQTALGTGTKVNFTIQLPIVGLKVGDLIKLRAGCAHDIVTCHNKFANRDNFGGFPSLPKTNPFTPTGFGISEQI